MNMAFCFGRVACHFLTYVPMSICGAGWDFCSGLGHVDDNALYTQLDG